MHYLSPTDYTIIIVYVLLLLGIGFWLQRKAAGSLEDYFLGGRQLPWWALGTSGMASWLDITGTMIIVSFLYMLGPRGLYVEFRGGAVLVLAFMLVYTGKWHRRSGCITGAEWNIYRFGNEAGGKTTRLVTALAMIITTAGMLAYLVKGVGLFLSVFLPWSPTTCAILLLSVATIYTISSGFYGVVVTDIVQSIIMMVAVAIVIALTVSALGNYDGSLEELATKVTGNTKWTSSTLPFHTKMPPGYEAYQSLFMFALFYLLRNIMFGMGSGNEAKYFAARSERDCGLVSFLIGWMFMLRWPMMMGFAVLGLFLVNDSIPDQDVLPAAASLIREHLGAIPDTRWEDVLAGVINAPNRYPELVNELTALLGTDWPAKLKLLSAQGTVNPERIMPAVMLAKVPAGLRGLMLIALIAASMSTFDTTVNMAAGFFTRDIYQGFIRPRAGNRELMAASYLFIVGLVLMGFGLGYATKNINEIWSWIIMGLGAGLAMPGILRLYWWRFNAGGVIVGTVVGLLAAVVQRAYFNHWDDVTKFCIITVIGIVATVIGTYLTKPTPDKVLEHFYRTTRPFGLWGPYKRRLDPNVRVAMEREHRNDLIAIPFTLGWQITLFLLPMQLLIREFTDAAVTAVIFLFCLGGMYVFWYRNLPERNEDKPDAGRLPVAYEAPSTAPAATGNERD